jgi:hypothetical protein
LIKEIRITAYDEVGHTFEKKVTIDQGESGAILDFGWPCRYYIEDLMYTYPFKRDLCIDAGGLNHRGSAVWVKKDDVNMLFKKYLDREFG